VDITTETAEQRDAMHRILRTQASVLWLTAAIAAIAGLLATYQFLRRAATGVASSLATMQTLGTRRVEVTAGGALRGAMLGVAAATLAGAGAVALSPLFPRGVARLADPDVGVHADLTVLAIGALAVVLAGAGLGALAIWSAIWHAAGRDPVRPVPVPGAGPAASGVRFAFEPDARGVGSLRPGLLGAGATAAMLVAISTLGSSFDLLLGKAELSGGWWDAFIAAEGSDSEAITHGVETILTALRTEPGIAGLARGGWMEDTTIEGVQVPTMYLEPGAGIDPAMRAGEAPVGPTEIALAATTRRVLGVGLGDVVELGLPEPDGQPPSPIRLTVVGEVALGSPAFFDLGPGEGALVSHALLERWSPETAALTPLLLRFPEGADASASLAAILDGLEPAQPLAFLRSDRGDVAALHDLKTVPSLLALGVAALTLATLAHRVVMSARRHRRDYGVMRALGATRRQVRLGVGAQASTVAVIAFIIGVPLGLLLALLAWELVADELIVVPAVQVASGPLAAIIIVIVGLTMVVALLVCSGMQRRRPADLLHAE
jgi:hypothetical protein